MIKVSKLYIFVFHLHVYKFDVEEIDPHRFQTADEIQKLYTQVKTSQYIKEVDTWKSRYSKRLWGVHAKVNKEDKE